MKGLKYVVKAMLRKRFLAWQVLVIVALTAVPASISSTINYVGLYVEASIKIISEAGNLSLTHSTSSGTEVLYAVVNVSQDSLRGEAVLVCPGNLTEYMRIVGLGHGDAIIPQDGVLISEDLANELDIGSGDEVTLACGGGSVPVTVMGYVQGVKLMLTGNPGLCRIFPDVARQNYSALLAGVMPRRILVIEEVLSEIRNILGLWLALSSLVLFSLAGVLTAVLLNEFRPELRILHDLGAGKHTVTYGLIISSLVAAAAGTLLGASAGVVSAQALFKVGSLLGLLIELKPFLWVRDVLTILAINSAVVTCGSVLAYAIFSKGEVAGWKTRDAGA